MLEGDAGVITFVLDGLRASWSLFVPPGSTTGTRPLADAGSGPFVTVIVSEPGATAGTYSSVGGTLTLDQIDLRYGGGRVEGSLTAVLAPGDAGLSAVFTAEFR